jgi:hypothetical protein
MKDLTIFSITIFIILIFQTSSLLFKVTGEKKEYCFGKIINEDDIISLTYVVSSESEENIKVSLIRLFNNEIIFEDNSTESGSYRSEQGEDGGKFELCFIPKTDNKFYISFDFYTLSEGGVISDLAQDKDVQEMGEELKAVTTAFTEIESNARHINDRRFRHTKILNRIIASVQNLTYVKIGVVIILSLLQSFIIQRFFRPEKRVTKIKGAFSNEL